MSLAATTACAAGHYRGHDGRHGHHEYRSSRWVAPLIIGSVVGYAVSRPTYAEPAQVIYTPQPQTCSRVITQDQYGNIVRNEIRCY